MRISHEARVHNGPALAGYGAEAMRDALTAQMATMPEQLRRSLTWDRGGDPDRRRDNSDQRAGHETCQSRRLDSCTTGVGHCRYEPRDCLTRSNYRSVDDRNTYSPSRIHLQPGVPSARRVAGGRALHDQSLEALCSGQDLGPLSGLINVGGDRGQLQRRHPVVRQLLEPLSAHRPALGPQVDPAGGEQVERGKGGRWLGGLRAGSGWVGDEALLERVETQPAVSAEDDQLTVYL